MDLTVSDEYIELLPSRLINPRSQESIDRAFADVQKLPLRLEPGESVLLSTKETIEMSPGWLGLVCLRSTFARLGLISPPTVADPGFKGTLTLEVHNTSKSPILIESDTQLWSLHYLVVPDITQRYGGKYQGQSGITGPKAIRGVGDGQRKR